jgi:hypothetical protein
MLRYIFKWLTGKIDKLKTYVTETQFACSSELMLSNEHLLFISGRENNTSANLPQSFKCQLPVFFFNQAETVIYEQEFIYEHKYTYNIYCTVYWRETGIYLYAQ